MPNSVDMISIASLIVAIVAILVSLFEKNVRAWVINLFKNVFFFFRETWQYGWFRSIVLWLFFNFCLFVISFTGIKIPRESLIIASIVVSFVLLCLHIILQPTRDEASTINKKLKTLEDEVEVLSQAHKIQLESIQSRWEEFCIFLSHDSSCRAISAFLKLSKPIYVQNDVLLLSIPEVALKASGSLNIDSIAPLMEPFFGTKYQVKLVVQN